MSITTWTLNAVRVSEPVMLFPYMSSFFEVAQHLFKRACLFTLLSSSVRYPNSCVYYITYSLPIVFYEKKDKKQRLNKVLILFNSFLVFLPGYDQDAVPELSDFVKNEKKKRGYKRKTKLPRQR